MTRVSDVFQGIDEASERPRTSTSVHKEHWDRLTILTVCQDQCSRGGLIGRLAMLVAISKLNAE